AGQAIGVEGHIRAAAGAEVVADAQARVELEVFVLRVARIVLHVDVGDADIVEALADRDGEIHERLVALAPPAAGGSVVGRHGRELAEGERASDRTVGVEQADALPLHLVGAGNHLLRDDAAAHRAARAVTRGGAGARAGHEMHEVIRRRNEDRPWFPLELGKHLQEGALHVGDLGTRILWPYREARTGSNGSSMTTMVGTPPACRLRTAPRPTTSELRTIAHGLHAASSMSHATVPVPMGDVAGQRAGHVPRSYHEAAQGAEAAGGGRPEEVEAGHTRFEPDVQVGIAVAGAQ